MSQRAALSQCLAFILLAPSAFPQLTNRFELLDGDRVVLLGDALIEREQSYGYLEYVLTTEFPDRKVTFRNLGWSADTPAGISRASFDPPAKGFDRLKEQLAAIKPTVAFLGYGMASSFDGEAGLAKFAADLEKLMDTMQEISGQTKVRFVLLSPVFHEKIPPPLPDPAPHNAQLALYTKAIQDIARKRQTTFVSLFDNLSNSKYAPSFPACTDDGIHLTSYGYRRAAEALAMGLGWLPRVWRMGITKDGKERQGGYGIRAIRIDQKEDQVRVVAREENLPMPPWNECEQPQPLLTSQPHLQFILKAGRYEFRIDGKPYKIVSDRECRPGLTIDAGPELDQAEELRRAIVQKNELFFRRWRPENNTYLFLFRKHEQGQNAQEIPRFDPLIQEQEARIARLRKPIEHTFEVIPATNTSIVPPSAFAPASVSHSTPAPSPLPLPDLQLEPGFEISVWAENPLLAKPIQMNFDPQGRLWVASSSVYPQIAPGQSADDKILILEDTTGAGKANKSAVFADGLLIPTGVQPGDGGVYVGQGTELLHLKDTDGDGKADQRRVVLSGFGTEDTHHILHTLRWGPDGRLYMNQSIYIHSHLETPNGVVRLNSGGTLALNPGSMQAEIFMKGLINPWGHHFDEYGQSFATDGAGGIPPNGVFYVLPGGMYATYEGARRTLGSVSPGSYPKFCGLEIIHSAHFPPEWQGNMITCDFRANRIVRFAIKDHGSAYETREMPDLIRTTNVTFRPVDVKLGPDGALYIADWSNPIIQHGEVDFRDPRRDHEHGRIWRLSVKGRPLLKAPDFRAASTADLLDQLVSANGFNREQARRVLIERGTATLPDLVRWAGKQKGERALLEALWLYQALDTPEPLLLVKLLEAKDGRVRAAATRVLGQWHNQVENPLDLLASRIADDFPRVRLEALRALSRIPSARSANLALSVLDQPMDAFLDYAAWLTINELAQPWLASVESGSPRPSDGVKGEGHLEFALKSIEPALARRVLSRLLKDHPVTPDGAGSTIELIGYAGGPDELRLLLDQLLKGMEEPATLRVLTALEEAARLRNAKPSGELEAITHTSLRGDTTRAAAVRLFGTWKLSSATKQLLAVAGDPAQSPALREAAFSALREIGGQEAIEGLRSLASKNQDSATRRPAAVALMGIELRGDSSAARAKSIDLNPIIDVIASTTGEEQALSLWRGLLGLKGAGPALARALPRNGVPQVTAKVGLRVAREGARAESDLVIALARSAGLSDESQNLSESELLQIAARVKNGDAARGEKVYRRKDLGCTICHALAGAGGRVGPDLASIGASAQIDYLVESVLAPNKKVKEGYHSLQITTKDGQDLAGVPVRETSEELIIRDTTNKELSIPKNNIESRAIGGSLMPGGLIDFLAEQERLDLFRFLSELGKPGPFDAPKANIARTWRINPSTASPEEVLHSNLATGPWLPVYTTLDGALAKSDVEEALASPARREIFFAAARFQTSKSGPVNLTLTGLNSPKAWLDGKPVGGNAEITADLPPGPHTLMLKLDPSQIPPQIRLSAPNVTFLTEF